MFQRRNLCFCCSGEITLLGVVTKTWKMQNFDTTQKYKISSSPQKFKIVCPKIENPFLKPKISYPKNKRNYSALRCSPWYESLLLMVYDNIIFKTTPFDWREVRTYFYKNLFRLFTVFYIHLYTFLIVFYTFSKIVFFKKYNFSSENLRTPSEMQPPYWFYVFMSKFYVLGSKFCIRIGILYFRVQILYFRIQILYFRVQIWNFE